MPQSRQVLERQLAQAEHAQTLRVQSLSAAGKTEAQYSRDPQWRQLNADCHALRRRLNAVAAIEANNAEIERRKAEGAGDEEAAE